MLKHLAQKHFPDMELEQALVRPPLPPAGTHVLLVFEHQQPGLPPFVAGTGDPQVGAPGSTHELCPMTGVVPH